MGGGSPSASGGAGKPCGGLRAGWGGPRAQSVILERDVGTRARGTVQGEPRWGTQSARPSGNEVPPGRAQASRDPHGRRRTDGQTDDLPGPGGGRRLSPPHPRRRRPRSLASLDVSSSRRSRREQFNWQDLGLRTDVASLGLKAGRAREGGEGAGRSGVESGKNRLRETPARRSWREETKAGVSEDWEREADEEGQKIQLGKKTEQDGGW